MTWYKKKSTVVLLVAISFLIQMNDSNAQGNDSSGKQTVLRFVRFSTFSIMDTISTPFVNDSIYKCFFPIEFGHEFLYFDSLKKARYESEILIDTMCIIDGKAYFRNENRLKLIGRFFNDSLELFEVNLVYSDSNYNVKLTPQKHRIGLKDEINFVASSKFWDIDTNEDYSYCRKIEYDLDFIPLYSILCQSGAGIYEYKRVIAK